MIRTLRVPTSLLIELAVLSVLGLVGCGAQDSQPGGGSSGSQGGGQSCTAPTCGDCGSCFDACLCETGNAEQCVNACGSPVGGVGGANGVGGSGVGGSGAGGSGVGGSGVGGSGVGGSGVGGSGVGGSGGSGVGGSGVGGSGAGGSGGTSSIGPDGRLIPPAPGTGVQVLTKTFTVQPGTEAFRCFHTEIPIDGDFAVAGWESVMSEGSHHFILYKVASDSNPVGTLTNSGCTSGFGGDTWLFTSGSPHARLDFPAGVAMPLPSRQRVIFDMHYFNTTTRVITAQVALNVNLAKGTYEKASSLVSFNTGIAIPPRGTQTVQGDCTPGAGAKFFLMSTHTHRRGTLATISRKLANGQIGEEIVRTEDWEHPTAKYWGAAPFFTFQAGEKLHYSCSYQNDLAQTVTVGASADRNEMCMAINYFFPASAGGSCGF
jgi:Copper type II ascorbate-dependent monooxygenase, C-terminal domain